MATKIAKNNPNWILTVYNLTDESKVKLQRKIFNRTELEASNEAASFINNCYSRNDWSLTPAKNTPLEKKIIEL